MYKELQIARDYFKTYLDFNAQIGSRLGIERQSLTRIRQKIAHQ